MTDAETSRGERRAGELGVRVLAELVDSTRAAVVVLDDHRRTVYGNRAACQLLGRPLARLRGRDLLERVPVGERSTLRPHLDPRSADPRVTFASIVHGIDDTEQEVVGSALTVRTDGPPLVVVTLWDQSGQHSAMRTGVALAQTVALVGATSIDVMLGRIAQHAVEGTRASGCTVVVVGEDDEFADGGAYSSGHCPALVDWRPGGPGRATADPSATRWMRAVSGGAVVVGGAPGQPAVLPDARTMWEADPVTHDYAAAIAELSYQVGVAIPLSWQDRVIGLCILCLPPGIDVTTESELAFVTALADQAALAVVNARLTAQAGEIAALSERARLARELHDSVSQALFSMTMHARAAQLAMDKAGVDPDDPLAGSVGHVYDLTRDALAEMRALIFELRPDALADEGLVAALRRQGAVLSARERIIVTVDGPEPRIPVTAEVEQQLYRIAVEALHNVAEHARATEVSVRVETDPRTVRLTVADDGAGFDTRAPHAGRPGRSTMAERADAVGARLTITSAPGEGTTVSVVTPVY